MPKKGFYMKMIVQAIIFFFMSALVYAQEYGVVFSDNVRIRNAANKTGEIVGTVNTHDKIQLYTKAGTGKITNGIWDYWYKISDKEERWVNAFYVSTFPIYINGQNDHGGKNYILWDLIKTKEGAKYDYSEIGDKKHIISDSINKNVKDNPRIRLSDLAKQYINNHLSIGLGEGDSNTIIFYGIKIDVSTYKQIIDTLGEPDGGNDRGSFYYDVILGDNKVMISFISSLGNNSIDKFTQKIMYFSLGN